MKRRKLFILCVLGGLVFFAVMACVLLSNRNDDAGRYSQLLRARRAEARFMPWRTNAAYRFVSRVMGSDPVSHYRKKADQLEASLCKSGALVWLNFFAPAQPHQLSFKPDLVYFNPSGGRLSFVPLTSPRKSDAQCVRWSSFTGDQMSVLCRPRDVAFWQSAFCCITNRVRWGPLRKLVREEDSCRLPDGSTVDLDVCQKWLNQSIADGWMVGIRLESGLLVANRRKPGGTIE